ncbi:hypothetical protein QYF61_008186 [Mycteria americana]|uniref:SH3 domain-containing protein n=1 Tax=Mycteria americana TaxID=33587 RepID=A0AAN7MY27_MYCAM|nr:hypothetical protein QYF61_008186 [Mycteria americana]
MLSIAVTDELQGLFLVPQVPRAKALYTYRGHNPGELRFNKGDIIVLLRQLDENWYLGEVNGISGVFPASSVQVIKHLPLPPPLGRALYSFDLRSRDKTENKDCLPFHKVTPPRGSQGWATRAGLFSSLDSTVCRYSPAPQEAPSGNQVTASPSSAGLMRTEDKLGDKAGTFPTLGVRGVQPLRRHAHPTPRRAALCCQLGKGRKKGKPSGRQAVPGTTSETCHHVSLCLFQPNTTARQLLQTSKSHWSPQFKCASLRTASPKAKGADSPAFPKVPDSRRKSLRQFSITTALNTLNRMVHAPAERQALEISSPVLISSSNPTVATQSSEKAEFPYSTPLQVRQRRCGCCRSSASPKRKSWIETLDAQAAPAETLKHKRAKMKHACE